MKIIVDLPDGVYAAIKLNAVTLGFSIEAVEAKMSETAINCWRDILAEPGEFAYMAGDTAGERRLFETKLKAARANGLS